MKHLILMTETFRRAGINTMYRATLCVAVGAKPGISVLTLASLLETTPEAIRVAMRGLVSDHLVTVTKVLDKTNRSKETRVYPTPRLKDVISALTPQNKKTKP